MIQYIGIIMAVGSFQDILLLFLRELFIFPGRDFTKSLKKVAEDINVSSQCMPKARPIDEKIRNGMDIHVRWKNSDRFNPEWVETRGGAGGGASGKLFSTSIVGLYDRKQQVEEMQGDSRDSF